MLWVRKVYEYGMRSVKYHNFAARKVLIAGSFTNWQNNALPLDRHNNGDWTIDLTDLPLGLHEYKLIVDDVWTTDPDNRFRISDGHGGKNSAWVHGGPPAVTHRTLRVLSVNLHTYQEKHSIKKLEIIALAAAAMGAHVLLLQEVAEPIADKRLPHAGKYISSQLEAFTSLEWHHHWTEAHIGFNSFREGLSILSCLPLSDIERIQLSEGGLARVALGASLQVGLEQVRVVSVHTSWPPHALKEVQAMTTALHPYRPTHDLLVAGDFNGSPSANHVAQMKQEGFIDVGAVHGTTGPTFLDQPVNRIDYHFLLPSKDSQIRCSRFMRLFDGDFDRDKGFLPRVSDHAGLIADYEWASSQF